MRHFMTLVAAILSVTPAYSQQQGPGNGAGAGNVPQSGPLLLSYVEEAELTDGEATYNVTGTALVQDWALGGTWKLTAADQPMASHNQFPPGTINMPMSGNAVVPATKTNPLTGLEEQIVAVPVTVGYGWWGGGVIPVHGFSLNKPRGLKAEIAELRVHLITSAISGGKVLSVQSWIYSEAVNQDVTWQLQFRDPIRNQWLDVGNEGQTKVGTSRIDSRKEIEMTPGGQVSDYLGANNVVEARVVFRRADGQTGESAPVSVRALVEQWGGGPQG